MASPVSIAYKRNITSTNTCGKPAAGYCELGPGRQCFECDANSTNKKHPPEFMVNSEFDTPYSLRDVTWWQSQTWWETNVLGLTTKDNPLKVNITLSFGRSFHISGVIRVRFYNERPYKMFLEKSKDFGKTWTVLQYFAFNCEKLYNMSGTAPVIKNSPFNVTCTEDYGGQHPSRYGKVEYRFDSRYEPGCGYFDQDVQSFMLATNVRIRLEEPFSDGLGTLFPETEEFLNKYYYAISDILVTGRCNCNGHAQYCTGPRMEETCECEHNTMGSDCQMCKRLFNNRPWMPANATHANECQECQCNSHGLSCTYNDTLGVGICTRCQHNTEGQHCEKCQPMFYRDSGVPIEHPNTCVACNCFPEGITNDGSCLREAMPTQVAGQCQCKTNVLGRRCDQCIPGYWGFRLNPAGECRACRCNILGTVNNTIQCDQYTGACPCRKSIQGRYCDVCKDGFYFFPINLGQDCLRCPCDLGGAFPQCNKVTGSCSCRNGVEGSSCQRSQKGRFYPFLDFIRFEAEDMNGTFTVVNPSDGREVAFTGTGYAAFLPGQYAHASIRHIPASHHYQAVIRYTISSNCVFGSVAKVILKVETISFNESVEFNIFLEQLSHGSGQAWRSPDTVELFSGEVHNLTLIYNSTGGSDNCSFLVDSLVFLPDVNLTRAYTESTTDTQNQLQSCVRAKTSLSQLQSEQAYCKALVFVVSTEIYNGTLECGCDPVGTVAGSQCTDYGGQCSCQPGVVRRTCNSCDVGYYGFSSAGCTRCQCSNAGSLDSACHVTTGKCHCKVSVQGLNCDSCKPGTFHLDSVNHGGCLHCFGYGRAVRCTSASGFIASTITSQFVNETVFNWTVVNSTGKSVPFTTSSVNGLVVTSPSSPPVVYLAAPSVFLGAQYRSYGQRLHVKMEIRGPGTGHNPPTANGDVILVSGAKKVVLNFVRSPSPNVTSYHVVLDETHVVGGSVSPLEFQSILAELTSLRIRATYFAFPEGSVTFKEITLETAVSGMGALGGMTVGFVENATCNLNYTGLSCEQCAEGFTREKNGSGPFGRCVLCSCNNRSARCDRDTGTCTNCQVGTYGDHCQLCTNNVQGPECNQCKPGYWGLSENGCRACDCYLPGTAFGNDTVCDQETGQCNCNATVNIGGRRCDMCKENNWNTSAGLFSCKACPPCYSAIQEDVNLLRNKISSLHVRLSNLQNHPMMLHNQTFVERLRQLVAEVSELTKTINATLETERNSTSQWLQFAVAVNDLSASLNETITTTVNQTLHYTAIVEANRRETESTVTQIQDVVTEASRLLNTPMRLKLEQTEVSSISLAHLANQLVNVTYGMRQEKNRIVVSNETIHEHVEHAVEITNKAVQMVQNATDTQARVAVLLRQLHANASVVNAFGEHTLGMVSNKLRISSTAYNHSLEKLHETSQPNPDRSSDLQDLKRRSVVARGLITQYGTQVSNLYQSSTTAIVQVNAALERSLALGNEVRAALNNVTQVHQGSLAALTAGRNAVSTTNHLHEHAQRMLHVASKFETVSLQAQASADKALVGVPRVLNTTHEIIQQVSMVNESSSSTLSTATEALQLGSKVHNLSASEQQVVKRALRLANQLRNESSAKNGLINNTVEDFMAREIESVQKLCQNLSGMAFNVSENSAALLSRAGHVSTTTQRLSILIMRLLNESLLLPRINVDNLPTLRGEVGAARQQFGALQLGPHLEELRRGIQVQKEKMAVYKDRIRQLRANIDQTKKLLRSLPSGTSC